MHAKVTFSIGFSLAYALTTSRQFVSCRTVFLFHHSLSVSAVIGHSLSNKPSKRLMHAILTELREREEKKTRFCFV